MPVVCWCEAAARGWVADGAALSARKKRDLFITPAARNEREFTRTSGNMQELVTFLAEHADGIDEFLKVFLGRSRSSLDPLPGSVFLTATDTDRAWALAADWSLGERGDAAPAATIEATAAELLLLLWERASALVEPDRFRITGDAAVVRALESAPIHP